MSFVQSFRMLGVFQRNSFSLKRSLEHPSKYSILSRSISFGEGFQSVNVEKMFTPEGEKKPVYKLPLMVQEDEIVFSTIQKMSEHHRGSVLVLSNSKPTGIFTERDYLNRLILKGLASKETPIKDVLTTKPVFVNPNSNLKECIELMAANRVRNLPILASDGPEAENSENVIGMVLGNDVCRAAIPILEKLDCQDTVQDVYQYVLNKKNAEYSDQTFVSSTDTVFKAIQIMAENQMGGIMVFDFQNLVGILTERDYLHKIILKGRSSKSTLVSDIMSFRLTWASPKETLICCLKLMVAGRLRHIPILDMIGGSVDEESRLFGVLTLRDFISYLASKC